MVLCLVGVALCLCLEQKAFGQGSDLPPGFPFTAADSPLGWEGALLGKCQARKNLADRGITVLGVNQMFATGNVAGGKDQPVNNSAI
jgi:hypothetical protein